MYINRSMIITLMWPDSQPTVAVCQTMVKQLQDHYWPCIPLALGWHQSWMLKAAKKYKVLNFKALTIGMWNKQEYNASLDDALPCPHKEPQFKTPGDTNLDVNLLGNAAPLFCQTFNLTWNSPGCGLLWQNLALIRGLRGCFNMVLLSFCSSQGLKRVG